MTVLYFDKIKNFETWLKQNEAEAMDCVEGCLLDNAVYACKRGYAFVYESFVNSWSSEYKVKFVPYKEDSTALWQEWENFRDKNWAETA